MSLDFEINKNNCRHDTVFKFDNPTDDFEYIPFCSRCKTIIEIGDNYTLGYNCDLKCLSKLGFDLWKKCSIYLRFDDNNGGI